MPAKASATITQGYPKLKILGHATDHPWWMTGWSALPSGGLFKWCTQWVIPWLQAWSHFPDYKQLSNLLEIHQAQYSPTTLGATMGQPFRLWVTFGDQATVFGQHWSWWCSPIVAYQGCQNVMEIAKAQRCARAGGGGGGGGGLRNTYELLHLRALKISSPYKNRIFQCMGKIFCVEFQRYP